MPADPPHSPEGWSSCVTVPWVIWPVFCCWTFRKFPGSWHYTQWMSSYMRLDLHVESISVGQISRSRILPIFKYPVRSLLFKNNPPLITSFPISASTSPLSTLRCQTLKIAVYTRALFFPFPPTTLPSLVWFLFHPSPPHPPHTPLSLRRWNGMAPCLHIQRTFYWNPQLHLTVDSLPLAYILLESSGFLPSWLFFFLFCLLMFHVLLPVLKY